MERLRSLGYPVNAEPGAAGGYRLGAGAALPLLVLDDEEAVAVAVCLRTAASGTVTGIEETSMRALAKLELAVARKRSNDTVCREVRLARHGRVQDRGTDEGLTGRPAARQARNPPTTSVTSASPKHATVAAAKLD
jgi:predicted DNA-binding transcriptional regulator YafY